MALTDFVEDLRDTVRAEVSGIPVNAVVAQPASDGNAIAVTVSDDFSDLGLGGDRVTKVTTFQVDVYAGTYTALMSLKDAIIDRYHGVTRTLGTTVFKSMTVVFSAESASTLNNTVYRCIINIEART